MATSGDARQKQRNSSMASEGVPREGEYERGEGESETRAPSCRLLQARERGGEGGTLGRCPVSGLLVGNDLYLAAR